MLQDNVIEQYSKNKQDRRIWADVVLLNFHSYESTGKLNYTALEAMKEMLP